MYPCVSPGSHLFAIHTAIRLKIHAAIRNCAFIILLPPFLAPPSAGGFSCALLLQRYFGTIKSHKREFQNKKISLHSLADNCRTSAISCTSPTVNFIPSEANFREIVLESTPIFFASSCCVMQRSFSFPRSRFMSVDIISPPQKLAFLRVSGYRIASRRINVNTILAFSQRFFSILRFPIAILRFLSYSLKKR